MRCMVLGAFLLLALGPALRADDDKPDKKDLSPAEEVKKLIADFQKEQQEFYKELSQVKAPEERQKLFDEKMPKPEKTANRLLELAEKNPKDEGVVPDALLWIARFVQPDPGKAKDRALELLINHVDNPKVADLPLILSNAPKPSPNAEKLVRAILEKNPAREAQGKACYALAMILKNEDKSKEAEKLLERAATNYADVPLYSAKITVGDKASGELFELRNLAIGMTAPDIEAEDLDGNKFKLSEYRGKVVVIDFWGNW